MRKTDHIFNYTPAYYWHSVLYSLTFLGERGINERNSQMEMNWHLPVDDVDALGLKRYLVQSFDQKDISTYGLTFGISSEVEKADPYVLHRH